MTKRLILTRHAKSSWDTPSVDHDRPLNKRGYQSAPLMGKWLRSNGYVPDQIFSSSARRTVETCEGLGFEPAPILTSDLYHASAQCILDVLREATGDTVLIVGHNPGLADFAARILQNLPLHDHFFDYPTCATTVANFEVDNWDAVTFGMGHIQNFIIPKEIQQSALQLSQPLA